MMHWASGWAEERRSRAPSPRRAGPLSALREAAMPDLREVFEMVKQQTEPDLDSWTEQERRMRRAGRNRKVGALALVAALAAAAVVLVVRNAGDSGSNVAPATNPPSVSPLWIA